MNRPKSQGHLGSRLPVSLSSEDPVSIEQIFHEGKEYDLFGIDGDYLHSLQHLDSGYLTFTETNYTETYLEGLVDFDKFTVKNCKLRAFYLVTLGNDTANEKTYVRLYNETDGSAITDSEVYVTGSGETTVESSVLDFSDYIGVKRISLRAKVTAGTGKIYNDGMNLYFLNEIGGV